MTTSDPIPAPIPARIPAPSVTVGECPSCGADVLPDERFCEACGADLPTERCHCGGVYEGDWCSTCGARRPRERDHLELTITGAGAVTDRGQLHHRNEDAVGLASHPDGAAILVVCDGVSSTVQPQDASQAAADAAVAALLADPDDLDRAFDAATEAVAAVGYLARADLGPPSCTFLAAVVDGRTIRLAAVGDCRAYWVARDGDAGAELLSIDDSWLQEQIAADVDAELAERDPRAHVITRWIGRDADPAWRPRLIEHQPDGPGRLLLCSDGLWNYLDRPGAPSTRLRALLDHGLPATEAAAALVAFANAAGGHDNITAAIADLPGSAPHQEHDAEPAQRQAEGS